MSKELVLVVDDEEGIREIVSDILTDEDYRVISAESGEDALKLLAGEAPELIFLDVWLPGMDGLETLTKIKEISPDTTVIMISGHGTIETAVKATSAGAYDFLEKPLSLERVVLAAQRALEQNSLKRQNRELRESLGQKWKLVGDSTAIAQVRSQINMAAKSNSRVLITGPSGTGKEIVAHALHSLSVRTEMPFVEVNCAAIPQELIESELFGHEKGSFTGAFEQKRGKFEIADGGTLFLDEIGDMSFQTQAKLLRVLESQEFQRVGGSKSIKVDTRVIAATNQNLEELISKNKFRSDLYFRLNVIPISLPSLSERLEDIPILVQHFLDVLAVEYRQPARELSEQAIKRLLSHDWPGNIRELKNLIERLVIMTPSGIIGPESLTFGAQTASASYFEINALRAAREAFEKDFITKKLAEHKGNISRTATTLEIERSNLHRKIKAYKIPQK